LRNLGFASDLATIGSLLSMQARALQDDAAKAARPRSAGTYGEFCLSVIDNGVGQGNLRPSTGTGMGHNLVRMLAAQLGGGLNAHDAGPGSAFVVTFPASPV
jgi:two-component sensor histidine kinase